jgi:TolB protein
MGADGSNPRRLSTQGGKSYDPSWSPDGRRIAYVVERSGEGFEIWTMDADGGNAMQLTQSGGSNESPSWSPDSRHVVFGSSRSGTWQLYSVTVDTGVVHPVPNMAGLRCEGPSWGPRRSK